MPVEIVVKLECCGAALRVSFNETESPATAPSEIRKNVCCPTCGRLLILSLKHGKEVTVDQEII